MKTEIALTWRTMTLEQKEQAKKVFLPRWIRDDHREPEVMRSGAGYYIGTCTRDYAPYARYTHYMCEAEAKALLKSGEWVFYARPTP